MRTQNPFSASDTAWWLEEHIFVEPIGLRITISGPLITRTSLGRLHKSSKSHALHQYYKGTAWDKLEPPKKLALGEEIIFSYLFDGFVRRKWALSSRPYFTLFLCLKTPNMGTSFVFLRTKSSAYRYTYSSFSMPMKIPAYRIQEVTFGTWNEK